MSAERMPQERPALLGAPLLGLTRLAVRFPLAVTVSAAVAAVAAIVLAFVGLDFHTSRLDLISPESEFNKLWIDYVNQFGDADDVVVLVEGKSQSQVVPVLDELARATERETRHFRAVLHKIDLAVIRSKGLHYANPRDLAALESFVLETRPIVAGRWTHLGVGNMAAAMQARLVAAQRDPSGEAGRRLAVESERLAASLQGALAPQPRYLSPWPEMPPIEPPSGQLSGGYLLANEGRLGFVLLQLAKEKKGGFARGTGAIESLRGLVASVQARHPETKIGVTGLPVMENDEMRTSQVDMLESTLLSLVGVVCVFAAGFGGLRHPLLAVVALLVAMAWSFGYITIAVGHLNILSVSFAVVLIGLGIDFGIHFAARYLELRGAGSACDEALGRASVAVGPGIVTGAATTAVAFFAARLTEFTGVAELGVVAGGGILLCCLAALGVLPALIHLADARRRDKAFPVPLDIHRWLSPLFGRPILLLSATGAATLLLATGTFRLWYDHNLLNLQSEELESVRLERKLLEETDQSVWFAISLAKDREEALERKARFERLESVERVEEIASLIPPDGEVKQPAIERIRKQLEGLPDRPPQIPIQRPEVLGQVLAGLEGALAATPQGARIAPGIRIVRDRLRGMPESECFRRLSEYQHQVACDLLARLRGLEQIADPRPPQRADLPASLVSRFVGADGRYLLKVYSRGDIWDMDAMQRFVSEVRGVDPKATGNPLQTYEASRQMKRSYEKAALYALVAIFAIIYFDFRSLRYTLLAMLPLGLGTLQLFGILGWLNVPLNPANMIVLPLILGIGVDDGVHLVHDYLGCRGRYRMSPSTATSVVLTSLTTMVGFGSLMIASHQGLQSLGRVLTIGVTCCLFTSLVMLPAILVWATRNRSISAEGSREEHQPSARVRLVEDGVYATVESESDGARPDGLNASPPPWRRAA